MEDKYITLDKLFMQYGVMPYLYLIKALEIEERYEECLMIKNIILNKASKFDVVLPVQLNETSIKWFKEMFKDSKNDGDVALANMVHYVAELREKANI